MAVSSESQAVGSRGMAEIIGPRGRVVHDDDGRIDALAGDRSPFPEQAFASPRAARHTGGSAARSDA
jgi:hypothetical protein